MKLLVLQNYLCEPDVFHYYVTLPFLIPIMLHSHIFYLIKICFYIINYHKNFSLCYKCTRLIN